MPMVVLPLREAGRFQPRSERAVARGYTALKFYPLATPELDPDGHIRHVAKRSIDRAMEVRAVESVKAVRSAIGPNADLMLDISGELTTDALRRLGRRFEEYDITFLEEPVDAFDPEALKEVAEHVKIPVATGERMYTRYQSGA